MGDKRLFFLFNRAQHTLLKWVDTYLADELGITSVQLAALYVIKNKNGCLLKELSEELCQNNSAITGLSGRMQKAGLIERRECESDGRAFRVFLTPMAESIIEQSHPLLDTYNERLREDFSDEEIDIVLRFFRSVLLKFKH